ncbi:UDP-N-acetylmuramoyl-L-alanyl-D-glutamate--2,6-diaminopimelate ligase [Phytoactinopolyspora mesophila]|uniref:UDP-N-acetylmuramoyl-L-alanyl-D-glutamate--2, 6-diaminopimelate ligase n=1 Tax=Phytoactinopolyspora mesophila TaxID=2650750 RepID=UPI001391B7ED|nr:UDP-N-acetylmuramoyl-L-alanyl-D-glutamate--2,6-diaminopimelate ligase [Phytoactinopolyspora mesophila]
MRPSGLAPYPVANLRSLLPLGAVPEVGDLTVSGITHDSRQVRPGDLYAALPGAVTHGARFIDAAVGAGAAAVLTDEEGAEIAGWAAPDTPAGGSVSGAVPMIVVDHPRAWLGGIAAAVYRHPAHDLLMLGVTGTNGKTTTAYLLESGLRHAGYVTGMIGTVEIRVGDEVVPSVRTTPEATDMQAILAVMRERGIQACVMEVSSHALAFGRADGISYDVAGFTNLSRDHLDFHTDLEDYFGAKARLFSVRRSRQAVICVDDTHGRRLAAEVEIPVVTVATASSGGPAPAASSAAASAPGPAADPRAGWRVQRGEVTRLVDGGRSVELQVPLPGDFNVANSALAVVMLVQAGVDPEVAAAGVGRCPGVPGRMEQVRVDDPDAPMMVVDYAHTPDAIENVLRALRSQTPGRPAGRLVVVTGAGGNRDRDKRPLMGAAAARNADVVIVTDDNPRLEHPPEIRAAVLAGAERISEEERAEVVEVADRRAAIRAALARAHGPQDTVVVLGKGHEPGQEIGGTVHPFDDRDVLREEHLDKIGRHGE